MSFTNPILIRGSEARILHRKSFARADAAFDEQQLQRHLFAHPSAIPLKEIAPHLGAVAPVCMELNTLAGPADILYVSATGQVVLVETKLWRNPEARRTVVAQILDYAKELAYWRYEDLDREVAKATGQGPGRLLEAAKERFPDLDERSFVDGINHSLRTGDVVLLIVGDGIRSGTEALVGFLEQYGNLRFTFGLIEVAAFELDGALLLCPRVLARTEVIRRTVVVATNRSGEEVEPTEVAVGAVADPPGSSTERDEAPGNSEAAEFAQWLLGFWPEFMQRLRLDDRSQPTPPRSPKSSNAYFPMPPNGSSAWVSVYLARTWDHIGVYLSFSKYYDRGAETFDYLRADKEAIEAGFTEPLEWVENADGSRTIRLTHTLGDWRDPVVRDRHLAFVVDNVNRFVNTFRPRLQAFLRDEGPR